MMQIEFKGRASANGLLMTDAKEKQPLDLYLESLSELERLKAIQDGLSNTTTKVYIDRASKIQELENKLPELEANKNKTILSETTKSYLQEWLKEQIYGVRNEIHSKYLTKGIEMEDESINVYALHTELDFAIKNSKRFDNEFITGEPDLILEDKIVDIKTSWDCFTFPLFETEIPNKNYYWQLQSYMALTGKRNAELVYVLVNTPEHLQYNNLDRVDYSNFDLKHRVKIFKVDRNDEDIQRLYDRVNDCRTYLNELANGI